MRGRRRFTRGPECPPGRVSGRVPRAGGNGVKFQALRPARQRVPFESYPRTSKRAAASGANVNAWRAACTDAPEPCAVAPAPGCAADGLGESTAGRVCARACESARWKSIRIIGS